MRLLGRGDDNRRGNQSDERWSREYQVGRILVGHKQSAFLTARGAPPPRALARRRRFATLHSVASLGPQALPGRRIPARPYFSVSVGTNGPPTVNAAM